MGLNPCSNGILKYTTYTHTYKELYDVLILVLMEY